MDGTREARTAPFHAIPARRLVSVEHPAMVRNLDKAIDTLQGDAGIKKVCIKHSPSPRNRTLADLSQIMNPPKPDTPANLVLRPDDFMARPVTSSSVVSNNVLLKVTVPKKTGRRRKKGSNEPFTDPPPEEASERPWRRTAQDIQRTLQDNPSNYTVEPVGKVERTHLFRSMPDYVYSTTNSEFTQRFRNSIAPYNCKKPSSDLYTRHTDISQWRT